MARYAILSDIHSNLEALNAVLEKCRELNISDYISLGDIVGYNTDPAECIAMVRQLNLTARVRGNHDDYVCFGNIEESGFNPNAQKAILWSREHISEDDRKWLMSCEHVARLPKLNTTIVHATLDTPANWGYIFDSFHAEDNFRYQLSCLCFCGHSHVPAAFIKRQLTAPGERQVDILPGWENNLQQPENDTDFSVSDVMTVEYRKNNKYLLNVGSIGQPRNSDPRASFAVLDTDSHTVSRYRIPYDYAVTQQKIRAAGLPERLAQRLSYGS